MSVGLRLLYSSFFFVQLNLVGTVLNQQLNQDQQSQQNILGQQQQQDQQIQNQLNQDQQKQQGRHLMSFLNGINNDINNKVCLTCDPHLLGTVRAFALHVTIWFTCAMIGRHCQALTDDAVLHLHSQEVCQRSGWWRLSSLLIAQGRHLSRL